MSEHYTIRGHATGQDYLVHVSDGRFWLYPPGTFTLPHTLHRDNGTTREYGLSYSPLIGQEITRRYPWMSHRRARRLVLKAERRVARAMRGIYRANSFAQRQHP
jgi:hypothetical protein